MDINKQIIIELKEENAKLRLKISSQLKYYHTWNLINLLIENEIKQEELCNL